MHTDAPFDCAQGRLLGARCLNNDRSRVVVGRMRDVRRGPSAVSWCGRKRTYRTYRTQRTYCTYRTRYIRLRA